MSELFTQVVEIDEVNTHPNADRLELVHVKGTGYWCVSQKGLYTVGSKAVFLSPDTVIPEWLENAAWEGTKISRPHKGRITAMKLRGIVSPGLLLNLKTALLPEDAPVGLDVKEQLGLKKYEPGELPMSARGVQVSKAKLHKDFHKYTSVENIKHHIYAFKPTDRVVAEVKYHGMNMRFGWMLAAPKPTKPLHKDFSKKNLVNHFTNLKTKVLQLFNAAPKYEFVVGSHNVELEDTEINWKNNVFFQIAKKYSLKEKTKDFPGHIFYGEALNTQKGYTYGYKTGEVGFVAFDVVKEGKTLSREEARAICDKLWLPFAKEVYRGEFDLEKLNDIAAENTEVGIPCREGIVIRNEIQQPGTLVVKLINPEYLLQKTTDYH